MKYPEDFINKIIQGDCLEVMKDIPDKSIDLVLTDPPYGIDFQSARRIDKTQWKPKIANDLEPYTPWIENAFCALKDGGRLICFTRWDTETTFREEIERVGFILKSQIIWDKIVHGMGDLKGDFAPKHENIIYATKGRYEFEGNRPMSVISVDRVPAEKLLHPNEKPLGIISYLLKALTKENDTILDPFVGGGSTLVAAKMLKRNFIGIEILSEYCKIAEERLRQETLL